MPVTKLASGKTKPPEKPIAVLPNGQKIFAYKPGTETPVCNSLRTGQFKQGQVADGKRCTSTAVMINGRCRKHGGTVPRGPESPNFVHGKYSKAPERVKAAIARSLRDQQQLSMRVDIAVIDARLEELVEGIEETIDDVTLKRLRGITKSMKRAMALDDPLERIRTLRPLVEQLEALVEKGENYHGNWSKVISTQLARSKMVQVERQKLQMDAEQIHRDDVLAFFGEFVGEVLQIMNDPTELTQFQRVVDSRLQQAEKAFRNELAALGDGTDSEGEDGEEILEAEYTVDAPNEDDYEDD